MAGDGLEDRAVALDGGVVALEILLVQRREAQVDRHQLALVADRAHPRHQHVGELLVAALRLVDLAELGEHQRLVGRHPPRREQRGERVVRTPQLLVDLGDPQERGRRAIGEQLCFRVQGREQIFDAALALRDPDLRSEQQRVALVERERLLQHRGRLLGPAQAIFEERPRLGEIVRAQHIVAERVREQPVDVRQRGVIALLGVVRLQLDQQRDVLRARFEALLQDALCVVFAREPRLEDQRLLQQQRGPARVVGHGVELGVEELHHHLPVADIGEEPTRRLDVADEPRAPA